MDLGDFADDASDELIGDESYAQEESVAESCKRKLMGHTGRSAGGGGADLLCWLCDAPMVVGQASNKWYNRELHNGCFDSVRCHKRLLKTTADKEADTQPLENDEEEWKSVVRGLVADSELRSEAARRAARAQIKNRETCIDSGQVEDDLLLTKRRFISYMGLRDGYCSDTASESLERRLQCSDSDHGNERGKTVKRQKIQAEAASRVETEGADVTEAKTFEMVTTSPLIDENGIAQVAMNVGHFSVAAHHGKAWVVVSLQSNMVNCCRLATRSIGTPVKKRQQFSSPEEIGGIHHKKTAMDFMVAKDALKKKIHEAIQEATGPKSLKQRLSGAFEKWSQEQLDELQKQVDPSAHDQLITKKMNALKDLSTQLQDAGRTEKDTIEVNITTIIEELQTISEAGEEQLEVVKFLLEQERDKVRKEQQSKRYIRARLATRLTQGSYGSRYAKFVARHG